MSYIIFLKESRKKRITNMSLLHVSNFTKKSLAGPIISFFH